MPAIRFAQIDAFADRPFTGNPAAVMPLDAWLPDKVLQAIAAENNLAETAFLLPDATGEADYELRWFTPAVEVALCGHATLASGHFVLTDEPARDRVRFRTRQAGVLEVARGEGGAYNMALPAWKPEPLDLPAVEAAAGVRALASFWHPQRYAVLVLEDADAVRAAEPDFRAMAAQGDLLTILTAAGDGQTDIVSRAFAPGAGIDEDPVTGSAHAVLAPIWAERLGRPRFSAFQASRRGGRLDCEVAGDRVFLGGRCVTVIEGAFRLPGT